MKHFLNKVVGAFLIALVMWSPAHAASTRTIEATNTEGFYSSENLVKQSGFETGRAQWTASGGTFAVTSTNPYRGSYMATWDSSSAGQTLMSASVPIPVGMRGQDGVVSCPILCASGTCTHQLMVYDGTNEIGATTINSSTSNFVSTTVNFGQFASSGNIRLRLKSVAADEPSISLDECVLTTANSFNRVGMAQAWALGKLVYDTSSQAWSQTASGTIASFSANGSMGTPTISGNALEATTKIPAIRILNAKKGVYIPTFRGIVYSAGTAGTQCRFHDGTTAGEVSASYNGNPSSGNSSNSIVQSSFYYNDDKADVTFQLQCGTLTGTSQTLYVGSASAGNQATFELLYYPSGSSVYAVTGTQYNYDWTSYTPIFTALGTVTSPECKHRREGPDLLVECKFTKGTGTASEARASLPSGLTTAGTDKIPATRPCGFHFRGDAATGARGGAVLCSPGVTYFNFSRSGVFSSSNSVTISSPSNGDTVEADGQPLFFSASVPIAGWGPVNAPIIAGNVVTGSSGTERIERARISHSADSTCSITSQSGSWLGSVSCNTAGSVTVNIASGVFSAAPTCTCSSENNAANSVSCSLYASPDSATQIRTWQHSGGAAINDAYRLICMGPRGPN